MIKYVVGDATQPIGDGNKIIVHVCNDIGAWGSGFVLALSKRWSLPKLAYQEWYGTNKVCAGAEVICPKLYGEQDFQLGAVQFVQVENDLWVANMIGQRSCYSGDQPPVRYGAIDQALKGVAAFAKMHNATVHGPRFGAGLSGGEWEKIEASIESILCINNIDVTIYDLI